MMQRMQPIRRHTSNQALRRCRFDWCRLDLERAVSALSLLRPQTPDDAPPFHCFPRSHRNQSSIGAIPNRNLNPYGV
jgi:hypothetical protein